MVRTRKSPLWNRRDSLDSEAKTQDLRAGRIKSHAVPQVVPNCDRRNSLRPCDDGDRWREQHINWGVPELRSQTLPWTPTTVRWRRSLVLSEKLLGLSEASRRMRDPDFHLPASTNLHFSPLVRQQKEGKTWIYSIVLQATTWHTGVCWRYAGALTEEQLDRPLPTVVELLPWRESNKTLRQLLENIIFTKEVWTAALSGAEMDMNGPPKSQRSPQAMLQRLEKTDAQLHRILGDIRNRSSWTILRRRSV